MALRDLVTEMLSLYRKHGWSLRRVLLTPENQDQLPCDIVPADAVLQESSINAMWFSRASHEGREAWELRLLSQQPFALFETFESDETEDQREEMRTEMEARMRDHLTVARD